MARTSSSENPLAMRPMTVDGRSPLRKPCISGIISAGWRPEIGGTCASISAFTAWQPEQEDTPAGGSAAAATEKISGSRRLPAFGAS